MEQANQQQENKKTGNPFLKQTMTYGFITGLVLIIYTLLLYMTNNLVDQNTILGLLNWVILIAGMYLGIKSYRDQFLDGYISYGHSLGAGVLISVFTGIILGIFTYLLYTVIDPDLMDKSMRVIQEEMLQRGMTESEVETMTQMQESFRSPLLMMIGSIISYAIIGFIISLILSIFTKKDKPIFNQ